MWKLYRIINAFSVSCFNPSWHYSLVTHKFPSFLPSLFLHDVSCGNVCPMPIIFSILYSFLWLHCWNTSSVDEEPSLWLNVSIWGIPSLDGLLSRRQTILPESSLVWLRISMTNLPRGLTGRQTGNMGRVEAWNTFRKGGVGSIEFWVLCWNTRYGEFYSGE